MVAKLAPSPHPTLFERTIPIEYRDTPFTQAGELSRLIGGDLYLKNETVSPIGSFKGRGTFHYCALHSRPGLHYVCASAGNFGQGMAAAATSHGCRITVFASNNANPLKIEAMRRLGATVCLAGQDFDEAKDVARAFAAAHGAIFVEDGAEDAVTEGASSMGHEMLDSGVAFDRVVLPLGNGALVCGVARAFKSRSPSTEIIGVVAEGAPSMAYSWMAKSIRTMPARTIADGIAVRSPVPEIMNELCRVVDDVVMVSEHDLKLAMTTVYRSEGIVTEPAGAAGVAALLRYPERFRGQRVASALCGRNVSDELRAGLYGGGV